MCKMIEPRSLFYLFVLYGIPFIFGVWGMAAMLSFHLIWVPMIFKYSAGFRRCLIFANFVRWPLHVNFEQPKASGIEGARNFTIEFHSAVDNCAVQIGVWHILPINVYEKMNKVFVDSNKKDLEEMMNAELSTTKRPIIFYCHGKMSSRVATHRLQLYWLLQKMDCHIIAFDYRGYGDSTDVSPSRDGVVEDTVMVYAWLQNLINRNGVKQQVYVWGHSLGAAIASHMIGDIEDLNYTLFKDRPLPKPRGIILEAPFNNIVDEIIHHSAVKLVNILPYFDIMFIEPFRRDERVKFEPDRKLVKETTIPIMILHAEDDVLVPFVLGRKLYESIAQSRAGVGTKILFHAFSNSKRFGNKWICLSQELSGLVKNFMDICQEDSKCTIANGKIFEFNNNK